MYAEFATDPKVQMMPEDMQRRFIMILCLRCSNGYVTLQDEEVAFQLRISNDEWAKTKSFLQSKGLIDDSGMPSKWDKRQYASDNSSHRVKQHRERKKQACNVTVTPTETETETETKIKTPKAPAQAPEVLERFGRFWNAYPRKTAKANAQKSFVKIKPTEELLETMLKALEWQKEQDSWKKDDGKFIPHPASWLNGARWEDAPVGASPDPDDWKTHPFFRGGI